MNIHSNVSRCFRLNQTNCYDFQHTRVSVDRRHSCTTPTVNVHEERHTFSDHSHCADIIMCIYIYITQLPSIWLSIRTFVYKSWYNLTATIHKYTYIYRQMYTICLSTSVSYFYLHFVTFKWKRIFFYISRSLSKIDRSPRHVMFIHWGGTLIV